MKNKIWSAGFGAVLAAGMLWAFPMAAGAAPVLPEGVSAEGESLAGQTCEEALKTIDEHTKKFAGQEILLNVDGQEIKTTAGELGLSLKNEDEIQKELSGLTGGSLVKQYMRQEDLSRSPVDIQAETGIDPARTEEFIKAQTKDMDTGAKDASITRENGTFVITDEVEGKTVDVEATRKALEDALNAQGETAGEPLKAEAVIISAKPAVTRKDLETIQDVLGTFTTDFSSSGAARSTNLTVGAQKINGHVLMPGQVLSGYECLHPFTTENGYKAAAAYENGQVVDSIGGGVCQIATTLYNSALEAELEIVQRQNHSMIVTYVEPSRDAAIAGTYKDIKIKNNYSTPIYVEGHTEGKKLTFTIYGKETRPSNRKVTYVSETLGTTDPGEPQLIVDNSLAPGAKVKVQSSHTGRRSRLWKVVTVDGKEIERTLLNQDTYNASKAIYRVGPAVPATAPAESAPQQTPEATSPAETQAPSQPTPVTGENGGPGVTAPAAAESAPGPSPESVSPAPAGPGASPAGPAAESVQIQEVSP